MTSIVEDYPRSLPDPDVLATAAREDRILITNDRDFSELVFREGRSHHGVIYLRLGTYEFSPILARLTDVLDAYADQLDQFIVSLPDASAFDIVHRSAAESDL